MTHSRPLLAKLSEDHSKLRAVNDAEVSGLINYLLTILNIKSSTKEEVELLGVQMLVLEDFLKTKFGHLTIPEIREAFKMYVSKGFAEIKVFRLLDCIAVGEVLNAYIDFRAESLRSYSEKKRKLENQLPEISDSQKEEIIKSGVNRIFQEYQDSKTAQENTEYIFDFLIEKSIIKNGNNPKVILYYQSKLDEAAKLVRQDVSKLIASSDGVIRKNAIQELNNFSLSDNNKIIIKAKRLVLFDFFDKQINLGKTIIF